MFNRGAFRELFAFSTAFRSSSASSSANLRSSCALLFQAGVSLFWTPFDTGLEPDQPDFFGDSSTFVSLLEFDPNQLLFFAGSSTFSSLVSLLFEPNHPVFCLGSCTNQISLA